MKGLPAELVYILVFAAILLFQYMTRRGGKLGPPQSSPEELESQTPDESPPDLPELEQTAWFDSPLPRASGQELRPPEPPAAIPAIPGRRFSRRSLMGNRREVQKAIVIAAIVGPCRAFEPHDVR